MAAGKCSKRFTKFKSGKGFTLVELIVVLSVMAILAASGIITAVGYVKRSKFNQNQANAEIIYNAAQTALEQREKAGTIDNWTDYLKNYGTALASTGSNKLENPDYDVDYSESDYASFPKSNSKPNESVHMRYVLTYYPGSTSDASTLLKNLIQPYFYDASIFSGTITAEFVAEKSLDAYKNVHKSARCVSVFVNTHDKNGWGATVPARDYTTRRNTSLVGYYEGYKGHTIDTVHLPQAQIVLRRFVAENVMVEVSPTPDPGTGGNPGAGGNAGTGGNAGEGETNDPILEKHIWLSWTATLDKANLMGTKGAKLYYKIELLNGSDVSKVLILNESFMHDGDDVGDLDRSEDYTELKNKGEGETVNGHPVTVETIPVDYGDFVENKTIRSITIDAQFYINTNGNDYDSSNSTSIRSKLQKVKLQISYVSGEYNSDHTEKTPYFAYSFDATDLLDTDTDGARMTVYPNDFTNASMKNIINTLAVIPYKQGKKVTIDQSEEQTQTQTNP